jgi:glycerophosphoryl diester phosphodiesterase
MSKNIAHRGASGYYPENTMLAFEKAIEMGCDGIETDVHLTKDGIAVICHDETIDRTTDGNGFIKDYTYKELLRFDAGIKFGDKFKGLKIPSLDEFIDLIKNRDLIINFELKDDKIKYKDIEKIVLDKIYKAKIEDNSIISSFNHYSVMKCRELDKNIKTGFLYDNQLYDPGSYGKRAGVYALHPNYITLEDDIVENIKNSNLKINTYTVNEEKDMTRLAKLGIDGIITNYPDKLKTILDCLK